MLNEYSPEILGLKLTLCSFAFNKLYSVSIKFEFYTIEKGLDVLKILVAKYGSAGDYIQDNENYTATAMWKVGNSGIIYKTFLIGCRAELLFLTTDAELMAKVTEWEKEKAK